jgi:hypothetical protein
MPTFHDVVNAFSENGSIAHQHLELRAIWQGSRFRLRGRSRRLDAAATDDTDRRIEGEKKCVPGPSFVAAMAASGRRRLKLSKGKSAAGTVQKLAQFRLAALKHSKSMGGEDVGVPTLARRRALSAAASKQHNDKVSAVSASNLQAIKSLGSERRNKEQCGGTSSLRGLTPKRRFMSSKPGDFGTVVI